MASSNKIFIDYAIVTGNYNAFAAKFDKSPAKVLDWILDTPEHNLLEELVKILTRDPTMRYAIKCTEGHLRIYKSIAAYGLSADCLVPVHRFMPKIDSIAV
jgi:hypothetical protein